ncbi:unnamed protein product, partial [Iphiclides podalirius]
MAFRLCASVSITIVLWSDVRERDGAPIVLVARMSSAVLDGSVVAARLVARVVSLSVVAAALNLLSHLADSGCARPHCG